MKEDYQPLRSGNVTYGEITAHFSFEIATLCKALENGALYPYMDRLTRNMQESKSLSSILTKMRRSPSEIPVLSSLDTESSEEGAFALMTPLIPHYRGELAIMRKNLRLIERGYAQAFQGISMDVRLRRFDVDDAGIEDIANYPNAHIVVPVQEKKAVLYWTCIDVESDTVNERPHECEWQKARTDDLEELYQSFDVAVNHSLMVADCLGAEQGPHTNSKGYNPFPAKKYNLTEALFPFVVEYYASIYRSSSMSAKARLNRTAPTSSRQNTHPDEAEPIPFKQHRCAPRGSHPPSRRRRADL